MVMGSSEEKEKKASIINNLPIAIPPATATGQAAKITQCNNNAPRRFSFQKIKFFVLCFFAGAVILQLFNISSSSLPFMETTTTTRQTPVSTRHTIHYNHDSIFYASDSKARSACTNLDNLVLPTQTNDNDNNNSTRYKQLFAECMRGLAQTQLTANTQCSNGNQSSQFLYFHVFWARGELPATAELGLRSILHSHKEKQCDDDYGYQVILWTLYPQTHALLTRQMEKYNNNNNIIGENNDNKTHELVSVQLLNATNLMQRMISNYPNLTENILSAKRLLYGLFVYQENKLGFASLSDVVRVLVLAAYGGVYLDLDVLVLRSFRPLIGRDFYYRWSTQDYCNTAVMGLQKKSPNTAAILKASLGRAERLEDLAKLYHPQAIYKLAQGVNATIELLPSAYFDPLWVVHDVYDDDSKKAVKQQYGLNGFVRWFAEKKPVTTPMEFFPGAFSFHWHNQWNEPVVSGTIPWMFLRYYASG